MKIKNSFLRDLVWLLLIVGAYHLLWEIMRGTQMVEKLMTMAFSWWEFLLVAAFVVTRLLTYLFIPPLIVAVSVYALTVWILGRRGSFRPKTKINS